MSAPSGRREWLAGALAGGAALVSGPATADGPDVVETERLKAEVEALRTRLASAERDLASSRSLIAMATGAVPFEPTLLKAGAPTDRIVLPSATRVERDGDPGKKRPMAPDGPAVLTFWATWCKPCTSDAELSRLTDLKARLRAVGGTLLSLAVDDLAKVRADPRASRWVYPYWQIEDGHLELLPRTFIERRGVGLPLTLVLDATGGVRWIRDGALGDEIVTELVLAVSLSRGRAS